MKNYILFLSLILLSLGVQAQDTGPVTEQEDHNIYSRINMPNSGIGIKGGLNLVHIRDINGRETTGLADLASFHVGAYAQIPFNRSLSLQPEVIYSRKGYERDNITYRFGYVDIPLLLVYNITDNFSVHLGPQMGIMVLAQEGSQEVLLDPYNIIDYGGAVGTELRLNRFRLGSRYNMSFNNLRQAEQPGGAANENLRHGILQLYIGFGI